jgi:hypothetical protein
MCAERRDGRFFLFIRFLLPQSPARENNYRRRRDRRVSRGAIGRSRATENRRAGSRCLHSLNSLLPIWRPLKIDSPALSISRRGSAVFSAIVLSRELRVVPSPDRAGTTPNV